MRHFQSMTSILSCLCKPGKTVMPVAALLFLPLSAVAQSFPPSLDPPPSAFDPVGNPVATAPLPQPGLLSLGHILDSTNGDVDTHCNSSRFKCVLPANDTLQSTGVLDGESGLVWERQPDTTSRSWEQAIRHCAELKVGGRSGWHLPMREQLATLMDFINPSDNSVLPMDHPFDLLSVNPLPYWSATSSVVNHPADAWYVDFSDGTVNSQVKAGAIGVGGTPVNTFSWCVRGGQSFDGTTSGAGSVESGGSGTVE